ncbi:MAG: C4-dicarboxylate ABC transporter substrate-binding protein, partial [Desulfuromonas thiophila]|nr:C4-dicarboxylate ABC transporter substrate-binding protein [Desulfuromonas thiophila]
QGLFVHLVNERWLQRLPEDLRAILLRVVAEESADTRQRTRIQYDEQVAAAKAAGVQFYPLSAAQQQTLVELAAPVYKRWEERIGADYLAKARQLLAP